MQLIFVVRDHVAETTLRPEYFPTTGAALRWFTERANDPDSLFNKHPADYSLECHGTYDENATQGVAAWDILDKPNELGFAEGYIQDGSPPE